MKTVIILFFAFSSLVAFSQPTIPITKSMLDKPTKMKLSELVDDITFIRLKTSKESFVKYRDVVRYTKDFIYFQEKVFTWDGKWKVDVGTVGRGPYEEVDGTWDIAFKDDKFYSKGYKLIEYDINGKPTKKIRYLDEPENKRDLKSSLRIAGNIVFFGKNIFLASADAIYFVNPDNFQTISRFKQYKTNSTLT